MATAHHLLDFVGGPFDGYELTTAHRPDDEFLFIPVAGTTDLHLNSIALSRGAQPTSLAIYELQRSEVGWSYCFLCADTPIQITPPNTSSGR
jgi:hypothetical protein